MFSKIKKIPQSLPEGQADTNPGMHSLLAFFSKKPTLPDEAIAYMKTHPESHTILSDLFMAMQQARIPLNKQTIAVVDAHTQDIGKAFYLFYKLNQLSFYPIEQGISLQDLFSALREVQELVETIDLMSTEDTGLDPQLFRLLIHFSNNLYPFKKLIHTMQQHSICIARVASDLIQFKSESCNHLVDLLVACLQNGNYSTELVHQLLKHQSVLQNLASAAQILGDSPYATWFFTDIDTVAPQATYCARIIKTLSEHSASIGTLEKTQLEQIASCSNVGTFLCINHLSTVEGFSRQLYLDVLKHHAVFNSPKMEQAFRDIPLFCFFNSQDLNIFKGILAQPHLEEDQIHTLCELVASKYHSQNTLTH